MMGTTAGSSSSSSNQNLNVFTAAQWEELEQQALIYKYMVSGVPVPTDLILSVRRSLYNSTSSSSHLSNYQPTLGVWEGGYHQYNQLYHQLGGISGGHGRKIDLEPGRCRRTDGKKWRCSKEAYPDSKYCERHMHRGRNRSRKPVEFPSSSSSSTASTTLSTTVSSSPSSTTLYKSVSHSDNNNTYSQFSSLQTNFMDYRYLQGMKELGEDERSAYLQLHDPYTNTSAQKMTPHHQHHHNYSHFNFQNLKEEQQHKQVVEEETQGQHCYVMGTDFIKSREENSTTQINTKSDENTSTKQPFHHFFSTPKTTPNPNPNPNQNPNPDPAAWVEIDQHQHHLINPTKSTLSTQDLFQSTPRPYW